MFHLKVSVVGLLWGTYPARCKDLTLITHLSTKEVTVRYDARGQVMLCSRVRLTQKLDITSRHQCKVVPSEVLGVLISMKEP